MTRRSTPPPLHPTSTLPPYLSYSSFSCETLDWDEVVDTFAKWTLRKVGFRPPMSIRQKLFRLRVPRRQTYPRTRFPVTRGVYQYKEEQRSRYTKERVLTLAHKGDSGVRDPDRDRGTILVESREERLQRRPRPTRDRRVGAVRNTQETRDGHARRPETWGNPTPTMVEVDEDEVMIVHVVEFSKSEY